MITKKDSKGIIVIILFFFICTVAKKQYQNFLYTYHIDNIKTKLNKYTC